MSLSTASLSYDQLQLINPTNVNMEYLSYPNMPNYYVFSIWEAIMEIVVGAYRIASENLSEITDNNPACYFILKNCLNSVLIALNGSTDAIIK